MTIFDVQCNLIKPTRLYNYTILDTICSTSSNIKFITCFRSCAWNMEPCPWSAKLPFSYILNVWESGTQAQDLHISRYWNLSFQSSFHCRTKLPCMVSSWHHDIIMTSLDLWSKKKHLSKAGCNYGLLPDPRHLLPTERNIPESSCDPYYQLNSATGTIYHRLSIEARICSKSMRELVTNRIDKSSEWKWIKMTLLCNVTPCLAKEDLQ